MIDAAKAFGRFIAICRDEDGCELWRETFDNLLTQTGKAMLLDEGLSGSGYSAAEYMGLISSTSFTAISGGDTPGSHTGWLEAGAAHAPTYSGNRGTCVWNAAVVSGAAAYTATKALDDAIVFIITGAGTLQGAFIVGQGATNSIDDASGTMYAVGTFSTAQPVVPTNTVTITYSTTMT